MSAPSAKALKYASKPPKPKSYSPEARVSYLSKRLASQVGEGHLRQALKTVDQLIDLAPTANLASTKIALLLHLDLYPAALALIDSLPPVEQAELAFERAYGCYRLAREAEAGEVLEADQGEGGRFLKAQLAYRAHEYEEAMDIYDSLMALYPPSHPAHADIAQNHALASSRATFSRTGYLDILSLSSSDVDVDALEEVVPVLPELWRENALAGPSNSRVKTVDAKVAKGGRKRRNVLPKGAKEGESFTEDPDRWMPLSTRISNPKSANYNPNYTSGTSMSNIASTGGAPPPAAKKKGGAGKKKGKK